jgi:hypothetical protein
VAAWLEVAAYAFSAAVVAWAAVVGPALLGGGPAARNTAPRHS